MQESCGYCKRRSISELYKKLDTAEGNKIIYKLAKARNFDNIFINDKGQIQTDTTKIIEVWREHYVELLNVTNPRKYLEECENTCGPTPNITLEEVGTQFKKMKTGKACGPDQIPIEVWKLLGDEGLGYRLQIMNAVLSLVEGMLQSWRKSEISSLHKGKGSVLECVNYRGIKSMAHPITFWWRILDHRIRHIVELDYI